MDVNEALRTRYTCRDFKPIPVLKGVLLEVLDEANRAPSWADTQPWEVYVATGPALEKIRMDYQDRFAKGVAPHPDLPAPTQWPPVLKQRMDELLDLHKKEAQSGSSAPMDPQAYLARQMRFFNAPAVVYIAMDKTLTPWSIFDLGLFTQSLMLAAKEKGLETAPAYRLVAYPDLIRQEMSIPENLSIVFGVALGYGAERSKTHSFDSPRRHIKDLVHFKGFEGPQHEG